MSRVASMAVGSRSVMILLRKELVQIGRSRGALITATLLPLLVMTVMPILQLLTLRAGGGAGRASSAGAGLAPGLAEFANDPTGFYVRVTLPMFITLGGLLVPSVSATYTVIAERERRSLDLLMALPVSVAEILMAKLLAVLVVAVTVVLPLFAIDMVLLVAVGVVPPIDIVLLLSLLISALACSIGVALLLALLARDFRTANNLNGVLVGPMILATIGILFLVPGPGRYVLLIVLLLLVGAAAVEAGLRWVTFERYLG